MEEQRYVITDVDSFELRDILSVVNVLDGMPKMMEATRV